MVERRANEALTRVPHFYIIMTNEQIVSYPKEEYITGGTLYQYLHISKRKMKYLLENGYIPYIDTGKQTHRYIVRIADAEAFKLRLASDAELLTGIQGNFSSNCKRPAKIPTMSVNPTKQNSEKFKKYLQLLWADEPDAIPAKRAAELVGFPSQRIYALCDQKKIFSVRINDRIFCSKDSVIAHFASVERIAKPFATARYAELIKEFAEQL